MVAIDRFKPICQEVQNERAAYDICLLDKQCFKQSSDTCIMEIAAASVMKASVQMMVELFFFYQGLTFGNHVPFGYCRISL